MRNIIIALLFMALSCGIAVTTTGGNPVLSGLICPSLEAKKLLGRENGHCREHEVPEGSECYPGRVRALQCSDCGTGEKLYALGYRTGKGPRRWGFELGRVRIPSNRALEFESFVRKNSPVKCSGRIIFPPCDPGSTDMNVEIAWPSWVRFVRD